MRKKKRYVSRAATKAVTWVLIAVLVGLMVIVLCGLGVLPPAWLDVINSYIPESSPIHELIEIIQTSMSESQPLPTSVITNDDGLTVQFIDVGNADCTLVVNGEHAMLIDAGNNGDGNAVVAYLRSIGIQKLEYCIVTHAHEDHAGGMDKVIEAFTPEKVMLPLVGSDTATYQEVVDAANALPSGSVLTPKVGDSYTLGDAVWTVIGCEPHNENNLNESSIMVKLSYGEKSFVFTGDAEAVNEKDAIKTGFDLSADVYKCGHHGSNTSNSQEFLNAVNPKIVVISCGANNDYGHPANEILLRLNNLGVQLHRTDQEGTVIVHTDGKTLGVTTAETATDGGEGYQTAA